MFLLFWTLGHRLRSILPPSPAPSKRYSRRTKIFVAIQDSPSPLLKYIDTEDMLMVSDSPPRSNVSNSGGFFSWQDASFSIKSIELSWCTTFCNNGARPIPIIKSRAGILPDSFGYEDFWETDHSSGKSVEMGQKNHYTNLRLYGVGCDGLFQVHHLLNLRHFPAFSFPHPPNTVCNPTLKFQQRFGLTTDNRVQTTLEQHRR